jgi:hypothetical protein
MNARAGSRGARRRFENDRNISCTLGEVRTTARMGLVVVAGVLAGGDAEARRRFFEPTDLEMENPGTLEVDLQFGILRGDAPWRVALPDVELDIGLAPGAEIDIDGAYSIEDFDDGALSFDHAPDDLWVAAKLELYDAVDEVTHAGWALGTQLGPKLPTARDARGVGYEGLVLLGRHWGSGNHLVLNMGGLVDPGAAVASRRPVGVEGGVDLSVALGGTNLSVSGELGGVRYFSAEPHQLHATAGITWASTSMLDISLIGLVGLLRGGDRAGVLLGVSPKIALWR